MDKITLKRNLPVLTGLVSDLLSFDVTFTCSLPVLSSRSPMAIPNFSRSDVSHLVLSELPELWIRGLQEFDFTLLERHLLELRTTVY